MRVGRRYGRSAMLAIDWTVGGTVFEMWRLRDRWHRDAFRQFDPLRVGLHIPN